MTGYFYLESQTPRQDTFFIMQDIFYSGLYTKYVVYEWIEKNKSMSVYHFRHVDVAHAISVNPSMKKQLSTFSNGRPFIKVHKNIAYDKFTKNMGKTKRVSAEFLQSR